MPLKEPKFKHNQTFLKLLGFGEHQKLFLVPWGVLEILILNVKKRSFLLVAL